VTPPRPKPDPTQSKPATASPARRRESRVDGARPKKRHQEILDAAAEIFYRKGYADTSVQDVADAVGILKGSLYYYIDSKEDLLFQMLLEVHEDAKAVVVDTAALDLPPLDRLRAYIKRHVEYNARNLAKIAVYYHDFGLLTRERRQEIAEQRRYYETFVISLITEAQENGDVEASVDPELLSNAIFGTVNWVYTWYRDGRSVAPEYLGDLYAEMLVSGISTKRLPPPPAAPTSARRERS
jgi:TetR/AcrR family transcriptional regulator, cholesterol catabolism regulator